MAENSGALGYDNGQDTDLEQMLYARHVEIDSLNDLTEQRGTPIPALFNQFYKFIQNPSTVSVETFKRMVDTDDTIGSGTDFLTTCLAARLGRYQHPSKEISKWVNAALDKMEGGFFNAVKELLSATWAGFAVSEKVWANDEMGFIIKKLVSLPPGTMLFETERTGELTEDGILQYQRNYNPAFLSFGVNFYNGFGGPGFRPDPYAKLGDLPFPIRSSNVFNYLSIRIPKQKCVHYAFDAQGKFGNPYGRSLLRRAYKWYVMKDAYLQMLSIALDRKGTPLTVVFADPNTTVLNENAALSGVNQKGKPSGIRADVAAREAFRNIHNDTMIVLPGKKGQTYDIEMVATASNVGDFLLAIDLCNKSEMRAMLVPSLIFSNGDGTGSYSLGQEHAKTFDKILDGMLAGCSEVLINQVIKEMICYNFPKSAFEKDGFGSFGKRQLSADEIQKEMECVKTGVDIGAIDMNDLDDLNQIRDKMGFKERDTPIASNATPQFDEFGNPVVPAGVGGEPGEGKPNPFEEGGSGKNTEGKNEAPNQKEGVKVPQVKEKTNEGVPNEAK